jgi:hypothetical protein
MNDVAKVLNDAADLIEQRGWTTETSARNQDGFPVDPSDERAVCWCLVGALDRAAALLPEPDGSRALGTARMVMRGNLGVAALGTWNDVQPGPEPVIAALRAAAQVTGRLPEEET